jgi:hypothetical protein
MAIFIKNKLRKIHWTIIKFYFLKVEIVECVCFLLVVATLKPKILEREHICALDFYLMSFT